MTRQTARGVSRREFLIGTGAVGSSFLGGCVENVQSSSGRDRGQVVVKGSSTVFLISDSMAEAFMEDNNVNVTVDSTGTGGGFKNHFCRGNADINGASRPITEEEIGQCQENDVEAIEFQVGRDALTVAVLENPTVEADAGTVAERVRERLAEAALDAEVRELAGEPGPALVTLAETEGYDEIVLGGGQESPLGKIDVGRIAEYVVLNATVTVTLVR
jgi:nucleotide-binding universal stress UspA family protein